MTGRSFDEDSAGKKVEKGLARDRALSVEVNAGAGVDLRGCTAGDPTGS